MSDAVKFVKANIAQFAESAPAANTKEWTEVDAGISKSTVLILIKKKKR
jgi:hypothetical protein